MNDAARKDNSKEYFMALEKPIESCGNAQRPSRLQRLTGYLDQLTLLLKSLNMNEVELLCGTLVDARSRGSTIFFAGNGGSASTAAHFSQDLAAVSDKTGGKPFRTVSLADNVPRITALANDFSYEQIFSKQLEEVFLARDVLVTISASGNSPNVVKAVETAHCLGGITVGLVGFNGGKLKSLCDVVVHVKSDPGAYGPVEDIHLILDHMVTDCIMYFDLQAGSREDHRDSSY
jgi:D-sedoheptulose 7-phosphate isomerase